MGGFALAILGVWVLAQLLAGDALHHLGIG